jgi:hypothetical protein
VFCVPLGASVPLQPPEAMHEVALLEFHVSTEMLPAATAVGEADKAAVGAGMSATVALAGGEVPPGPVQTIE